MEARITFRVEVYIEGDTLDEIKDKWMEMPLYSEEARTKHAAGLVEVVSAERVDDDSYTDLMHDFNL